MHRKMMPVGPLMIEHRLIERMIKVIANDLPRLKKEKRVDPFRVDMYVDFIRTYADRCHHGKEEGILFRELENKSDLDPELAQTMRQLIADHKFGRETTRKIVDANAAYRNGDGKALDVIIENLEVLVSFYPKHIEKEDRHFFMPCMKLFSQEEKDSMLAEGCEFDRGLFHNKYRDIVTSEEEGAEPKRNRPAKVPTFS